MRRLVATVGALLLCLAWCAAPVLALPGDDPFGPVSPPDGATFAPDPDGIPVAFTCPTYRVFTAGLGFTIFGGPDDYGVSFATAPALGTDGRLREDAIVALDEGHTSNTVPQGQCAATFAAGGAERPQERPGTYYWQVWRRCTGCESGYETGPVRRLVLHTPGRPRLQLPAHAYVGFPAFVGVRLEGVADGARATLERRVGKRWRAFGGDIMVGGAGEILVGLPRGAHHLRAVVRVGDETLIGPERTLVFAPARNWITGSGDDGSYSGRLGVHFKVTRDGREIRGFEADVPMLCPGIVGGQLTTQIGHTALPRMQIAPDGRFVGGGPLGPKTTTLVRGRLSHRKVTGGVAELSVGTCTGSARFTATR
jgi:hypothetical protein